ncbi:WD repeat domain phosphoinositide-interacting protein 2 [Nephila pilipes]|uniref:WD repeat domain phosphoinositide-interacting protein 2 n=1 Tax=Nephila pilipes TaxID=299642 RepID=A0A8X6NFI7_NEPPI|nr:WD repeat domain phosphoinositide-interacting protein 2 [Nephila pilipes]
MNLLEPTDEASGEVLFVNFNQDCTSLAVGTKKGFKLYSFNNLDELEVIHHNDTDDIRIIERLFSSSLVALVTISSPRKLKVCHFKKGTEICNYSYSNTILAVKLNRQRLVVCLVESLYIHNIRDMKVLHTIRDTPPNPAGLCVLSTSNEHNFLAYPGSSSIGEVQIFDALNLVGSIIDKILRVLVVSGEGILYILDLEPVEGGDCTLVKTHSLLDNEESINNSRSKDPPETLTDSPTVRGPFQPGGTSYAAIVRGAEAGTAQGV